MKIRNVFAFGAFVGTTFAMLFAPQRGEHIRMQMKEASEQGLDNLQPLKKGLKSLVSEVCRVSKMHISASTSKNPFQVSSLQK